MNRLQLPACRVFTDAKPLLHWPRFPLTVESRAVMAEFLPPRKIAQDILTVRCSVDGVEFELGRSDDKTIIPIVVRMEMKLVNVARAMKTLPILARALLVFDHRARSGEPAAVAMVGLIDAFAPRAGVKQLSSTNAVMLEADRALADVFGAVERWMEEGH